MLYTWCFCTTRLNIELIDPTVSPNGNSVIDSHGACVTTGNRFVFRTPLSKHHTESLIRCLYGKPKRAYHSCQSALTKPRPSCVIIIIRMRLMSCEARLT